MRDRRVLSADDQKIILHMYTVEQKNTAEIARHLDIKHRSTVRSFLERSGVEIRPNAGIYQFGENRALTESEELTAITLYEQGMCLEDVAEKLNTTGSTVKNTLTRHNKAARSISVAKIKFKGDDEKTIIETYLSGKNLIETGEIFDCNENTIANLLKRNNIKIRDNIILTPDQELLAVDLYQQGQSEQSIANLFSVSRGAVQHALTRKNIDRRTSRRFSYDEFSFDTIDTPDKAYWLGFIYADGTVAQQRQLAIGLGLKDTEHLWFFNRFMKSDQSVRVTKTYTSITFSSNHLGETLTKLGIVPRRGSFDLTLAGLPKHLYSHFIRGIMDGDGCITKKVPTLGFLGQLDILTWIKKTLIENAEVNRNVRIRQRKGIMCVSWSGRQIRKALEYIYSDADTYLERKKIIADHWITEIV